MFAIYYFLKNTNPKNQIILFLFCWPPNHIFFFNLVLSYQPKTGRSPQENYRNYSKRSSFASTTNWNCEQCGLMIQHILAFDLLPESPLFEGEYSAEPNKSMLVFEAKKNDSNYWSFNLAKIFEIKHTASGGFHVQGMSIKNWLIQKIWWFMWMHLIYVNFIVEVVFRAVTDTYHLWFIRGTISSGMQSQLLDNCSTHWFHRHDSRYVFFHSKSKNVGLHLAKNKILYRLQKLSYIDIINIFYWVLSSMKMSFVQLNFLLLVKKKR